MLRLPPEAIDAARGEAWGLRRLENPSVPQFMPHVGPIADWEKRLIEVGAEAQLKSDMEKVREFYVDWHHNWTHTGKDVQEQFRVKWGIEWLFRIEECFDSWLSHEEVK